MKALDARKVNEYFFGQQFDKILVDAPCSGLGLIRRKPEVRYEKQMEDLKHLSEIQYNILDHVAGLLAENGELVYSTCTISIEENEDVVKRFLTNHPDFSLAPFEVGNLSNCKMIKIFRMIIIVMAFLLPNSLKEVNYFGRSNLFYKCW